MERYAIIIRLNEETVLLHCYPGDSLDLKALQEIVEGHIETVPTALAGEWSHEQGVGLTLIINEEGKLLGMPVNRLATDMAYLFNDVIVGNAILIGTTDEDFIGLTKEAAENIVEKWGIKGYGVIETRFIIPPAGASFRAFWRRLSATTRANIRRRLIF